MKALLVVLALAISGAQVCPAQGDPFPPPAKPAIRLGPGLHFDSAVVGNKRLMTVLLKRHTISDEGLNIRALAELANLEFARASINNSVKEPAVTVSRQVKVSAPGGEMSLLEMLAAMSSALQVNFSEARGAVHVSITCLYVDGIDLVLVKSG